MRETLNGCTWFERRLGKTAASDVERRRQGALQYESANPDKDTRIGIDKKSGDFLKGGESSWRRNNACPKDPGIGCNMFPCCGDQ